MCVCKLEIKRTESSSQAGQKNFVRGGGLKLLQLGFCEENVPSDSRIVLDKL